MSDTPSGLKPVTIEAMFNTMTGNDPNQKWKLDERTGELVEDNEAGGDDKHAISTPDHPALVADALRRFPLGKYSETEIVGKIMKERGGNADPRALHQEIRRTLSAQD